MTKYDFGKEKLDESFFVRVSKSQKQAVKAIAIENNVSVMNVVRTFIAAGIGDYKSKQSK